MKFQYTRVLFKLKSGLKKLLKARQETQFEFTCNTSINIGRFLNNQNDLKLTTYIRICEELDICPAEFLKVVIKDTKALGPF